MEAELIAGIVTLSIVFIVATGFVCYWTGKDNGSKDAYTWRSRYEQERMQHRLTVKQCDGLKHELDSFHPGVWRNERWLPDQRRETHSGRP